MLQLGYLILLEKRRRNVRFGQERYFLRILTVLVLSFAADIASSLNQGPSWFFPFAAAAVYAEIILNTLLMPIFFAYVCEQIDDVNPRVRKTVALMVWVLTVVCVMMILSTAITGQVFYFDSARNYHRGPLFLVPMFVLFLMIVLVEGFIISQIYIIERNYFRSLALFLVPPLIGWALQSFIFGVPFSLLGMAFGAHMVFINIQNRNIDKDYLTGAFNRQTLDHYVQNKISSSTTKNSFAAIMLDIDNFKEINDLHGHYQGDVVIVDTVRLLRKSVEHNDFVARYGGDEFFIILDRDDPLGVERTLDNMAKNLKEYNLEKRKFQLSFSFGWAIYDPSFGNLPESLYKVLDQKMYDQKRQHRSTD
jgi:diguanylate cyclase (GGDEF)-like protein